MVYHGKYTEREDEREGRVFNPKEVDLIRIRTEGWGEGEKRSNPSDRWSMW
jgi:hypothetical protein